MPVFEIGQIDGNHFFTMAFVEGRSLSDRVSKSPLPPREAAEISRVVAQAISYAHSKGIIHRDLKPANILMDLDEKPKVTDFGLARILDQQGGNTRTGDVMGTPSYIPPEQAAGKNGSIGPHSDIYSLGAVLYHLLTGRPPFQAATPLETLLQVIEQEPVPVQFLNREVDRELAAICMKCLEKEPSLRYPSAQCFADDLQRYLDGEKISISSTLSVGRLWRGLDRHRDAGALATWGELLKIYAVISLVTELTIWGLALNAEQLPFAFEYAGLARLGQLAAMLLATWKYRTQLITSRRSISRLMWTQWTGFLIGCNLIFLVSIWGRRPMNLSHSMLDCYAYFSILSGILWFNLGSNFWGYCYVFGALFFLLSVVCSIVPMVGPAIFGVLWAACLIVTGRRLNRISHEKEISESVG